MLLWEAVVREEANRPGTGGERVRDQSTEKVTVPCTLLALAYILKSASAPNAFSRNARGIPSGSHTGHRLPNSH